MPMNYKLAASNIAWDAADDINVYYKLRESGFLGIEIAPTRFIADNPYHPANSKAVSKIALDIRNSSDLVIPSMQSIWYGRQERLFGGLNEKNFLLDYTKKAIDFSAAIGCPHIVFGSPRNRVLPVNGMAQDAVNFFSECASYASLKGIVIGIEANPVAYGTNFLNTTAQVIDFIKLINCPSLKVNLDLGAVIANNEDVNLFPDYLKYTSHIHISEPLLSPVTARPIHKMLRDAINNSDYSGWISLEMKSCPIDELFSSIEVVSNEFL